MRAHTVSSTVLVHALFDFVYPCPDVLEAELYRLHVCAARELCVSPSLLRLFDSPAFRGLSSSVSPLLIMALPLLTALPRPPSLPVLTIEF